MTTFPPTRILVAVDFGDASGHATRMAGALAERFGARLTGVHAEALEAPPYFTHDQIEALERQQTEARARAARYLEKFAARRTAVPIEPVIADGPPATAILDAAERHDLLVMGTHGRRGPSRWWLGSVAERVVRATPVPALVVRASDLDHEPTDHFTRILLVAPAGVVDASLERYLARLSEHFGGRAVERLTRCSEEMAMRRDASLVAVGVPGPSGGTFSDDAEKLIRTCRLPMLFVPEHPAGSRRIMGG